MIFQQGSKEVFIWHSAFFLYLHSYVRWLVIIFALLAIGRAFLGWFGHRPWTAVENRLGLFFTISFDVQLWLGAILYFFLSPLTTAALLSVSFCSLFPCFPLQPNQKAPEDASRFLGDIKP